MSGALTLVLMGVGLVRMRLDAGQISESWLTVVGYDRRPRSPTWRRGGGVVGQVAEASWVNASELGGRSGRRAQD